MHVSQMFTFVPVDGANHDGLDVVDIRLVINILLEIVLRVSVVREQNLSCGL